MEFVKGTVELVSRCGCGEIHYFVVDKDKVDTNCVVEPVGSFNVAVCHILREIDQSGKVVDIRIRARPTQKWWDDVYDEYIVEPSIKGNKITIEPLSIWFNVFEKPKGFWNTVLKNVNCTSTQAVLDYIRRQEDAKVFEEDLY